MADWTINSVARRIEVANASNVYADERNLVESDASGGGLEIHDPWDTPPPNTMFLRRGAENSYFIYNPATFPGWLFHCMGWCAVLPTDGGASALSETTIAFTVVNPITRRIYACVWNDQTGLIEITGPGVAISLTSGSLLQPSVALAAGSYTAHMRFASDPITPGDRRGRNSGFVYIGPVA